MESPDNSETRYEKAFDQLYRSSILRTLHQSELPAKVAFNAARELVGTHMSHRTSEEILAQQILSHLHLPGVHSCRCLLSCSFLGRVGCIVGFSFLAFLSCLFHFPCCLGLQACSRSLCWFLWRSKRLALNKSTISAGFGFMIGMREDFCWKAKPTLYWLLSVY